VYAYLTYRSRVAPLLIEINTRYGWVASPYPTGTSTPQETPSFARRDNDQAQRREASVWGALLCSASPFVFCHSQKFMKILISFKRPPGNNMEKIT
jgi:hypothetical protein